MDKINKQNAKFDNRHFANINKYCKRIDSLYQQLCTEAALLGKRTGFETSDEGSPFSFDDYPATKKKAQELFQQFNDDVLSTISTGISKEWGLSVEKNDKMIDLLLAGSGLSKEQLDRFKPRNLEGVKAFTERKQNGLDLSDRVWSQTEQAREHIELSITTGLANGTSASELSRTIREDLKEPHKLFRRVRDMNGILQLSRAARAYHPGQGVYRSSYKNAMRVARTEINMAYRKADSDYWQQSDIILGFRIELSNNHPIPDICDELAGEYPKTFVFTGWHPQCRCHAVPIVPKEEQIDDYLKRMVNGEDVEGNYQFDGAVTELPDSFTEWLGKNDSRIEAMKSKGTLPYFLRDNESLIHSVTTVKVRRLTQEEELQVLQDRIKEVRPIGQREADDILRPESSRVWKGATEDEKFAISGYTGYMYMDMNGYLREGIDVDELFKQITADAISYINKSHLPQDMTFTKQTGWEILEMFGLERSDIAQHLKTKSLEKIIGLKGKEKGFTSCFSYDNDRIHTPIRLEIYAPKGTKAAYAEPFSICGSGAGPEWDGTSLQDFFSNEQETIIQAGTEYQIIGTSFKSGQLFLQLAVVKQP